MNTFTEADTKYRLAVEAPGRELASATANAKMVPIDLTGTDITVAVLLRLKSFLLSQSMTKTELNKIYAAPAADFLVETVCFFLKVVLEKSNLGVSVASEKNIEQKRGSLRPDISIWKGGVVIAAIECKTQLGWNRTGWRDDFFGREARLIAVNKDAKLFLLVMTGSNWGGFGGDSQAGEQFFVLLDKIWPDKFDPNVSTAKDLVHPIEKLFTKVLAHAGA